MIRSNLGQPPRESNTLLSSPLFGSSPLSSCSPSTESSVSPRASINSEKKTDAFQFNFDGYESSILESLEKMNVNTENFNPSEMNNSNYFQIKNGENKYDNCWSLSNSCTVTNSENEENSVEKNLVDIMKTYLIGSYQQQMFMENEKKFRNFNSPRFSTNNNNDQNDLFVAFVNKPNYHNTVLDDEHKQTNIQQEENWSTNLYPNSKTDSILEVMGNKNNGATSKQFDSNNLDRVARVYRNSASRFDANCTWRGILPKSSNRIINYSPKVFLGGLPWDLTEQCLIQIFKPFGPIRVEWPGKEQKSAQPKGFVYIIFESEKQVKSLLSACLINNSSNSENYFFKVSSKRIKSKDIEVIPWVLGDSNFVKLTSQKLDPSKTVFVGALHGKLTAEALANIMNDLFEGVVYAGIDTDKYKYPIGSGRVTFNNSRSYMRAVDAAFVKIKTPKFTKKVQVDPYLEDSLCSICGVQHGPYFCRELACFRYFCRSCWFLQHRQRKYIQHIPLTRNSKSQQLIGFGLQSNPSTPTLNNVDPLTNMSNLNFMFDQQSQHCHTLTDRRSNISTIM